jgi:transposase
MVTKAGGMTAFEIAARLGRAKNTARDRADAAVEQGLLRLEDGPRGSRRYVAVVN